MRKKSTTTPIDAPALLSVPAAAKRLGISGGLLMSSLAGKQLPVVRIGGKRFVRAADVNRYLDRFGQDAVR